MKSEWSHHYLASVNGHNLECINQDVLRYCLLPNRVTPPLFIKLPSDLAGVRVRNSCWAWIYTLYAIDSLSSNSLTVLVSHRFGQSAASLTQTHGHSSEETSPVLTSLSPVLATLQLIEHSLNHSITISLRSLAPPPHLIDLSPPLLTQLPQPSVLIPKMLLWSPPLINLPLSTHTL